MSSTDPIKVNELPLDLLEESDLDAWLGRFDERDVGDAVGFWKKYATRKTIIDARLGVSPDEQDE